MRALLGIALEPEAIAEAPYADALDRAAAPTVTVAELVEIKDTAKRLIETAADADHREAARVVYYAAVAAAFVRHGARISSRAMSKQRPVFERLAIALRSDQLRTLFRDAAARVATEPPE
jgi:urate oxidase